MNIDQMIDLYVNKLVSMVDIAKSAGISRQAVHKALKKAGVSTNKSAAHREVLCTNCLRTITRPRCQVRNTNSLFCSRECYYTWLRNNLGGAALLSSQGCRSARAIVAAVFDLQPEHIVHHIDRNENNNTLSNLAVFATQAEHLRFHRGYPVTPIKTF